MSQLREDVAVATSWQCPPLRELLDSKGSNANFQTLVPNERRRYFSKIQLYLIRSLLNLATAFSSRGRSIHRRPVTYKLDEYTVLMPPVTIVLVLT